MSDTEKRVLQDIPKLQKRLFTPFLSKKVPDIPSLEEKKPFPKPNLFSAILFCWLIPLYNVGYKRTLIFEDLWSLRDDISIERTYGIFKARNEAGYSTMKSLFYTFSYEYTFALLAKILADLIQVLLPLLTKALVDFVEKKENSNNGIGYAIGCTIFLCINGILTNHSLYRAGLVGAKVKAILIKSLLEKSASVNEESQYTNSQITSLMGTDLTRLEFAIGFLPFGLAVPLPVIFAIALVIYNIGVSSLAGLGVFVLSVFVLGYCGKQMFKLRKIANKYTDQRIGLIREVLQYLKFIKLYAWEDAYESRYKSTRFHESSFIFKMQGLRNLMMAFVLTLPSIISMVSFLVLQSVDKSKNSADIFSSLSLFGVLCQEIMLLPVIIGVLTDGKVALERVDKFLISPDEHSDSVQITKLTENSIEAEDITLNNVQNTSLTIQSGEFVVIVGSVGSGKSSLIKAISGHTTTGLVRLNGNLILCDEPWIQSTTVRENITFGGSFSERLYNSTLKACSLEQDIQALPYGDLTQVGDRGVTLSGGQKARINLARAVYRDADIYLFDDILSAVDSRVGNSIINDCLFGVLKNKTRLLTTHHIPLIYQADKIIFVNEGNCLVGKLDDFKSNVEFQNLLSTGGFRNKNAELEKLNNDTEFLKMVQDEELIQDEEVAINSVGSKIIKKYLKSGSRLYFLFIPLNLMFLTLSIFTLIFANVWLSYWIQEKFAKNSGFYIGIYILLTLLCVLFTGLQFIMIAHFVVTASKRLNIESFTKILHVPMSFMDQTPVGRLLNRFTKDTEVLDAQFGEQVRLFLFISANLIGFVILCVVYMPWFAITIPIVIPLCVVIVNYYQASAREIKRIEAIQRSFVYSNFDEILNGMNTIKSYGMISKFLKKNDLALNKMNEAGFLVIANQRFISIMLTLVACVLSLVILLLIVTESFHVSPEGAGLVTNYVLQLVLLLSLLLRAYTEVENELNSVERVCHYASELEQEVPYKIEGCPLFTQGQIEFKDVSFRYRAELPLVLQNINLKIKAGEKIGIVGRTGSGKSTLGSALFKISNLSSGEIKIDDIDIKSIGLYNLRSQLSIIPQDPVLFKGTIRENIDPFNKYSDEEICFALKKSGLGFQLNAKVDEEGKNYSLGERQLLALTRALVRNTKVLYLDEATSNVDAKTDFKVQKIISEEFTNMTVLCVAHRLKTILKYDRVVVLDKGEIVECGEPLDLFKKHGIFSDMCEKALIREDDFVN